MKCVHCGYEQGEWDHNLDRYKGESGEFFKLSNNIILSRPAYIGEDVSYVYGCPKCGKLFFDIEE